jgi:predicted permease
MLLLTGYRALCRLLPETFRASAAELEAAAAECVARERARLGAPGVVLAGVYLFADVVRQSVAARLEGDGASRFRSPNVGPPRGPVEALMDNLKNDLRYALRGFARQPGFTLLTVLTLALGIGANTAIFSVVNGVLLRPLPYPNPDQLEYVTTKFPTLKFDQFWMSLPELLELSEHNESFSSVGAFSVGAVNLNSERPSRPVAATVTPGLLPTLGVRPYMGRWFTEEDSRPGAEDVAILSYDLWRGAFNGDPQVLGKKLLASEVSTTVVGVMPPGYDVHDQKIELWLPLTIDPATLPTRRGNHFLLAVARRKPGVTPEMARADLQRMQTHWADYAPAGAGHLLRNENADQHQLRIDPLKQDMIGGSRLALLVLQGAVGLVLLIACANLANLLLARAESRQREFAVRSALGAGRRRLFGQFVTEGLLLSLAAAVTGIGLAWLALQALLGINPDAIPRSAEVSLDWRVLLFTLALAVGTAFVFGFAPLFSVTRRVVQTLRDGTRTSSTRVQKAVRGTLVIAEVTLAVVLVAGAGLLVKSLSNLLTVDAGFNRSQLVSFSVVLPGASYNPTQRVAFFDQLEQQLGALPGVTAVTAMTGLPPNRSVNANDSDFEHIPNVNDPALPPQNVDYYQTVTPNYIQTMGIPVIKGRGFEPSDVTGPPVALINEAGVRQFYDSMNREPIGTHVKPGFGDSIPWFTIVGVVKDVKQGGVDQPVGTELYFLANQGPRVNGFAPTSMNIVMRTSRSASDLAPAISRTVGTIDPSLPIVKLRSMDEVFGDSVARPRFITMLLAIFAGLALVLAAIGTYGVLSYVVTQQSQEIGIRMALGADRANVVGLILWKGLILAGTGLVFGIGGALLLGRFLNTLLFEVSPRDPVMLAIVTLVMAGVAVLACVIPAYRATRVDPINTLRSAN